MKFLFGDNVKIVDGFFQGSIGVVTDYSGVDNKFYFEGRKEYINNTYTPIKVWINEQELEKAEE